MKANKRILALAVALLLALPLTGCLVAKDEPNENPTASDTAVPANDAQTNEPAGEPAANGFDSDAVAIELGDFKITAGEIANVFDQYIGLFSYSGSVGPDEVSQCIDMSVDYVLRYYVPMWKANELGVTLTEADEAEIEAAARADVEEEREGLICQFAYYYGITDFFPETSSELSEEELSAVLDAIQSELDGAFYEGFTFDEYLEQQLESYRKDHRSDRLSALLEAQAEQDLAVDAEAIDAWYADTLEKQRTGFDEVPSEYRNVAEDFASGESATPVLYVPAGFARIRVLTFVPDGDPDAQIDLNAASMKQLEAEYGALALNGADEARQAAIQSEYAALLEQNRALEEAYYAGVKSNVDAAVEALNGGTSFEDAMDRFNSHAEGESGLDERLVYVGGPDTRYGDLAAEAAKLKPGEVSKPVTVDGVYYIIQMVGPVPEGVVDRASIADAVNTAAAEASRADAWEALFDSWVTEARDVAVFHPETYESVGDFYLY